MNLGLALPKDFHEITDAYFLTIHQIQQPVHRSESDSACTFIAWLMIPRSPRTSM